LAKVKRPVPKPSRDARQAVTVRRVYCAHQAPSKTMRSTPSLYSYSNASSPP
jgi:hypothetical protein